MEIPLGVAFYQWLHLELTSVKEGALFLPVLLYIKKDHDSYKQKFFCKCVKFTSTEFICEF